jgi:hypothetical protein
MSLVRDMTAKTRPTCMTTMTSIKISAAASNCRVSLSLILNESAHPGSLGGSNLPTSRGLPERNAHNKQIELNKGG